MPGHAASQSAGIGKELHDRFLAINKYRKLDGKMPYTVSEFVAKNFDAATTPLIKRIHQACQNGQANSIDYAFQTAETSQKFPDLAWFCTRIDTLYRSEISGHRNTKTSDEAVFASMQYFTDQFLFENRALCADKNISELKDGLDIFDMPLPPLHRFCPAILFEAAKRESLATLYVNYGLALKINLAQFRRLVLDAANNNKTNVTINDHVIPVACPLALDAGVMFGMSMPDAPAGENLSERAINRMIERCYDTVRIGSTRDGVIAGAILGQRYSRQLN